jgi:hypothetical protein
MFDKELKRLNDNIETTKVQAGIIRDRVVGHVRRNKGTYIGIVASGLVCGVGGAVATRKPAGAIDIQALNKIGGGVTVISKSSLTQNNNVVKALGHPGFKVVEIATGIERPSINNTAKETGLNRHILQQHLHGDLPDVDGRLFKITGLADTSHLA